MNLDLSPNAFSILKQIAKNHYRKLIFTFGLVALENGQVWHALIYALMVLIIWAVGSVRRAVDTRVFVRIYSEIAVPVIINQKIKGTTSSAAAHATLSRPICGLF